MFDSNYWIDHLFLKPHPEGGYYREIYRSDEKINAEELPERYSESRNFSTSIYFLLRSEDISAFHRITSDELWFFHEGSAVDIYILNSNGLQIIRLGKDIVNSEVLQATILRNQWFAAKVVGLESYSLVSCTVSPGFDFDDFELAKRDGLEKEFPDHLETIHMLTH